MNIVEPIRDLSDVSEIANYIRKTSGEFAERNYILFLFLVYTGLRISDVLPRRVGEFRDGNGNLKDKIKIIEKKTETKKKKNKEHFVIIPKKLRKDLERYIRSREDYEYMFPSREGKNQKPLTRQRVNQILKKACGAFGYSHIGCHTTRKTFGYALYQDTKDIVLVKEILNHSDVDITRRYIGLSEDIKEKAINKINFF